MLKTTIIIPVYNAEETLENTVRSALNQTYKNVEIILIDDGSTDSSGAICDRFAAQDNRVKVRHIKNGGVSNARNTALEIASGAYISFLDSDDMMEPDMIKHLVDQLEKNSTNLSACGIIVEFSTGKAGVHKFPVTGVVNNENMDNVLHNWFDIYMLAIWNKLFKASIIKENKITFKKEMTINEDGVFVVEYFMHVSSAFFGNSPLYHYIQGNPTSLTAKFNPDAIRCSLVFLDSLRELIKTWGLDPDAYEDMLFEKQCAVIDASIFKMICSKNVWSRKDKKRYFKNCLEDKAVRKYFVKQNKIRKKILGMRLFWVSELYCALAGLLRKGKI